MKKNITFSPQNILFLWLMSFLVGCMQQSPKEKPQENYSTPLISIRHARNFSVKYTENYKHITILNPNQKGTKPIEYILYRRGTAPPTNFPEAILVEIPIRKIVTFSLSHLGFLEALSQENSIIGHSETQYIAYGITEKLVQTGKIAEVGTAETLDQEKILALRPDAIMLSAFSADVFQKFATLQKAGIVLILNAEWQENSPLGRAEWIKFVAMFYDLETEAESYFQKVEADYQALTKKTLNLNLKPTVFGGVPFEGIWYMPKGESYVATLWQDAGANYFWKHTQGVGSLPLDFEEVFVKAHQGDFWINAGLSRNLQELKNTDSRFLQFKALKNGAVYNFNKRANAQGGNDYWKSGVVNPQLLLADLIHIFHPTLLPNHTLIYYQKLQ